MPKFRPSDRRQPPLIEADEGTTYVPGGGPQPTPGEKTSIWHEWELHQKSGLRPIKRARFWGGSWWLLPLIIVIALVATLYKRWDIYGPFYREMFKAWFQ